MKRTAKIITSPNGDRLVVMPEEDYRVLLVAAEDDEELDPAFKAELERRRAETRPEMFVPLERKTLSR
jgi:PHD/YefM family antitoxin component YafN of YafNO toxin-antitoxin module